MLQKAMLMKLLRSCETNKVLHNSESLFFPNFEEVWRFRGYRLTRHPRRVVIFCCRILRCCARYDSVMVRWSGVGWGGMGLISFLDACTPT